MRKVPTIFKRDPEDMSRVLDEWHQDCLWVRDGGGVATRKFDGTCVRLAEDGSWWARREVKRGRPEPDGFIVAQVDPITGKTMGWEPMRQSAFAKFHAEALDVPAQSAFTPGTYELIGPKINGNPENVLMHCLVAHASADEVRAPRTFDGLRALLTNRFSFEGIVWHHPDGRMAKIKKRDFLW